MGMCKPAKGFAEALPSLALGFVVVFDFVLSDLDAVLALGVPFELVDDVLGLVVDLLKTDLPGEALLTVDLEGVLLEVVLALLEPVLGLAEADLDPVLFDLLEEELELLLPLELRAFLAADLTVDLAADLAADLTTDPGLALPPVDLVADLAADLATDLTADPGLALPPVDLVADLAADLATDLTADFALLVTACGSRFNRRFGS
jgi:hypothetical protein